MAKEKFYHGSSVKFEKFDLVHATEGDGKCKFGFGVYVTESAETARHYAFQGRGKTATEHYVYTVEVPAMTADNSIWSNRVVPDSIFARAEEKLGQLPREVKEKGKLFRKYVGNVLSGKKGTVRQLSGSADLAAEKAAAEFLLSIGVELLVWPQAQSKPDGLQNRAVLRASDVNIVQVNGVDSNVAR